MEFCWEGYNLLECIAGETGGGVTRRVTGTGLLEYMAGGPDKVDEDR